jgi:hypothetical protein
MDEVIYSAPWRPWQKSAILLAALLQRDWNTSPSQIGMPIYIAALLLFLHCCYSTCLPISFVHLHVPVASRWTKTVIPNLMLHCTKCILRARRICHCPSGSDSSGVAAATADAEEAVVAASGKLATVLIEVFALILKE